MRKLINIKEKNDLYKLFLLNSSTDYMELKTFLAGVYATEIVSEFNYIKYILIGVLNDLVNDGMIEIGQLNPEHNWDFEKWPTSNAESLLNLSQKILEISDYDSIWPGNICWFLATPEGDKLGNELIYKYGLKTNYGDWPERKNRTDLAQSMN